MNLNQAYQFILTCNELKSVFRRTQTNVLEPRQESTAEHSWSAAMIAMTLEKALVHEFGNLDFHLIQKLILIHDIVEIYAGDVVVFADKERQDKVALEQKAIVKLAEIYPDFGSELQTLWLEFEAQETLSSHIAKACDAICPIFQRLHSRQSYDDVKVGISRLDEIKIPIFSFSQTFQNLYQKLKQDLLNKQLIQIT